MSVQEIGVANNAFYGKSPARQRPVKTKKVTGSANGPIPAYGSQTTYAAHTC